MIDLGKHNVAGITIDAVDYESAVDQVIRAAQEKRRFTVSALAVHGVMTGVLDSVHRHRLNQFDLLVPDGQPVRWALRWLHNARLPDRVYGPNLMLRICEAAAKNRLPIYLYGATDEILVGLRGNLNKQFPGLQIAGSCPSRFRKLTPAERDEVGETIRASGACITFVGLGCPRQEVFTYEFGERLGMPLLAVGAAFAFHAGVLAQAPLWMQNRGLEWLYRLVHEPTRLWKRYLYLNPLFLTCLLLQRLRIKQFNPFDSTPPQQEILYG